MLHQKKLTLALMALAIASGTCAQTALPDDGFHGFVTTGQFRKNSNSAYGGGTALVAIAGLGYDFNKHLGLEIGQMLNSRLRVGYGNSTYDLQAEGTVFNVIGKYPLNETYKLFASVGAIAYSSSTTVTSGGSTTQWSDSKTLASYAFGGEMALDRRSSIRLQYFTTSKAEYSGGVQEWFDGLQATFIARF